MEETTPATHTLGQVLESAGRSDAIIYTVGLFDEYDEDRNPGVLRKIARATGGEAFLPDETSQVVPICERIAEDIRNQYTLGYVPSNQKLDNTYRTIKVTATGRHGKNSWCGQELATLPRRSGRLNRRVPRRTSDESLSCERVPPAKHYEGLKMPSRWSASWRWGTAWRCS